MQDSKKSRYFASQLNESIYVTNCAILLCFLRYIEKKDFKEKLMLHEISRTYHRVKDIRIL